MVDEIFNTTTKYITRAWYMSKTARTLAVAILIMVLVFVFVQTSSEPKLLTEFCYYPILKGTYLVIVSVLFIWLITIISLPRIEVVFGGGSSGWAKAEFGDAQIHQGGYIYGLVVTISNTGGRKLTLETRMVLRDRKTNSNLHKVSLMPHVPLSEQKWADRSESSKFIATQPLCPQLLKLKPEDTEIYKLYFFVDKTIIERLGNDTIGNNIPIPKIATVKQDLLFIDRGGILCLTVHLRGKGMIIDANAQDFTKVLYSKVSD